MTIALGILLLIAGIALGFRGLHVWIHCGYDCTVLPQPKLAAIIAMPLGVALAVIGAGILLAVLFIHAHRHG
ncbi:Na+-transporting methylmalonyl-CoA/oxaloacetate decarboxylase gamma subunit [Lysobacter niastensis]|uniref:Na+-transporting methylmalonyl-CoA/oxaloacetate decarboxylase gamma subunit n=1 Tax=Lysobacter niastensis TaxID=380629 RepID=A0ABU1W910_9GAMM|nr:hypothetical protein [Lysobacter niastensis]MDR7134059.1 Na+-transporting methylmalonyl-CoA/oxaloacetate decarboxylase gamma subunit [Lysobacter niastensis]